MKASCGMVAQLWWNHSLHALHWAKLPREVSWRSQGRRHWQYTVTFCTFFTLLRPNLLGVADRGNCNISPSSKQLAKCSRIFSGPNFQGRCRGGPKADDTGSTLLLSAPSSPSSVQISWVWLTGEMVTSLPLQSN